MRKLYVDKEIMVQLKLMCFVYKVANKTNKIQCTGTLQCTI